MSLVTVSVCPVWAILVIFTSTSGLPLDKILDLTWEFNNNTAHWPNARRFEFVKKIENRENYWYASNDYCAGEHAGTHLDAPYHFDEDGWKTSEIPITNLIGKGALIDLEKKTAGASLEAEDLDRWERDHGSFDNGTILLVKLGWSKYWGTGEYLGVDVDGKLHFPGISKSAADWLVRAGKFLGVGVDVASVDPGLSTDFVVHRTLMAHRMFHLENVKLVENLPARGFVIIALPMKIGDGTGGPVRILAVPLNHPLFLK